MRWIHRCHAYLSPHGLQVACGTDEGSILVWDLGTARKVSNLQGHCGPVWSLSYSGGSGALLASGGADETVRLWANAEACAAALTGPEAEAAATAATATPYRALETYRTKASPAISVYFTARNLLLAAGAFSLEKQRGQ